MDENINSTIRVLVVEPQKRPYEMEIENDLSAMQAVVGGYIDYFHLSDEAHIYCNEEGKLMGLPGNRRMDNGDIMAGTFFICGDDGNGGEKSLNDTQIEEYTNRFSEPELFSDKDVENAISIRFEPFDSIDDFFLKVESSQCDEDDMER